jgi:hypothetical protein
MVFITSLAVQLAFLLIFFGLFRQIRLGLRHQLPHGLRVGYMVSHLGRYLSWVVYGALVTSPDWLLIETRGIALALVSVVIAQRLRADLSLIKTLLVGLLTLSLLGGLIILLIQLPKHENVAQIAQAVVACFFALQLGYSIPLQYRRMTPHEARLVSTWYMSTLLFNNVANLAYGFARPDWMIVGVYSLATIAQGLLILRIRTLKNKERNTS